MSTDGTPPEVAQGPYRLIVVGDGRAAGWVRQLVRLEGHELPQRSPGAGGRCGMVAA